MDAPIVCGTFDLSGAVPYGRRSCPAGRRGTGASDVPPFGGDRGARAGRSGVPPRAVGVRVPSTPWQTPPIARAGLVHWRRSAIDRRRRSYLAGYSARPANHALAGHRPKIVAIWKARQGGGRGLWFYPTICAAIAAR